MRIGPIDYAVVADPKLSSQGKAGEFRPDTGVIVTAEDLTPADLFGTVWHEVVHGVLYHLGLGVDALPDTTVDGLAWGIVQVLRDNPDMRGNGLWPEEMTHGEPE